VSRWSTDVEVEAFDAGLDDDGQRVAGCQYYVTATSPDGLRYRHYERYQAARPGTRGRAIAEAIELQHRVDRALAKGSTPPKSAKWRRED